ncbi:DUF2092 domain-containing protein [Agrilutibacter solisilvae]|uniref:DUF2092 domain-containing protein n=1 Tax=Agrilutibacter solisilvae TaxID=2763317 RepID=A0A974Y1Q5_9GAMM|nr:DUF2092 domain-containing protein [Lysobacter solisilvae]QSX78795.1 DUF2092 domain-containing protein [Lysobacter solisilvae]
MHRGISLAAVLAAALVLPAAQAAPAQAAPAEPASAQQQAPAPPASDEAVYREPQPVVTRDARAVLDRMTAYLNGLDSFTVEAQVSRDETLPFGYKLQNNETARMTVQRPNRMRVDVDGDIKHRSYYYDGTTLTMLAPDEGVYASTPAPATVGEVVNGLLNNGVELPLIDVLRQGFQGSLLEGVRFGLLVGESTIDGVLTDHLAFRQPTIDWQLWVAKNGQPRKLLITTRYEVGDPQYQANLSWTEKPRIPADTFRFTAPKGAREIQFHSMRGTPSAGE